MITDTSSEAERSLPAPGLFARRETRIALVVYLVGLIAYAAPSGARLRQHSNDNHFVHLAYGWLHKRLDLGGPPPHSNDWAQVEWIHLKDGRLLKGVFLQGSTQILRTLRGQTVTIEPDQIAQRETKTYVSFPPFPAVVMLPIVAIWGMRTNDVIFTVALAPLAPALMFLLLRRLRRRGYSARSEIDDLWLTAVLAVGSVYYYSSVRGEIWYTAHVVAVIATILYASAALEARRPLWAGLMLGCAFLTRPQILFGGIFFVWELARTHLAPARQDLPATPPLLRERILELWARLDGRAVVKPLLRFAAPLAALGLAAAVLNVIRFGRPTEFGHTYLAVVQQAQIQKYGLFNFVYFGRNLACAFALTPVIVAGNPWIKVSWHGLAMWVTTPALFYLLWPKIKGPLHLPLWITVAVIALPDLMYQNSGWVQFGYRFSLDYFAFLILLLAVGGQELDWKFKALSVYALAINLFGAISFYWAGQFYFDGYFPPNIK